MEDKPLVPKKSNPAPLLAVVIPFVLFFFFVLFSAVVLGGGFPARLKYACLGIMQRSADIHNAYYGQHMGFLITVIILSLLGIFLLIGFIVISRVGSITLKTILKLKKNILFAVIFGIGALAALLLIIFAGFYINFEKSFPNLERCSRLSNNQDQLRLSAEHFKFLSTYTKSYGWAAYFNLCLAIIYYISLIVIHILARKADSNLLTVANV